MQNQDLLQNYLEQQQLIALENAREIQDGSFIANFTIANSTVQNTSSFNLIQSYATSEHYAAQISIDSTANVASGVTAVVYLQGSPDNATWANITELAATTFTGNASNVVANTSVVYRLSPDTPQYIRAVANIGNTNLGGANIVFTLRF